MLALTKKTDYALVALAYLARRGRSVTSSREIAAGSGVPCAMLTNILKCLTHAGLVTSERGSRGGYALAVEPGDITLHCLMTAIEGPSHVVRCMIPGQSDAGSACLLEKSCPVREPAKNVYNRLRKFLEGISLAELGVRVSQPVVTRVDSDQSPASLVGI